MSDLEYRVTNVQQTCFQVVWVWFGSVLVGDGLVMDIGLETGMHALEP